MGRDCNAARTVRRAAWLSRNHILWTNQRLLLRDLSARMPPLVPYSFATEHSSHGICPMSSGRLNPIARWLIGIAVFWVMPMAWTDSASASCGDHLQSSGQLQSHNRSQLPSSSINEPLRDDSAASQPHEAPRRPSPCRGLNCSKGTPLVPTPLPTKIQVEDQPCWLMACGLMIADAGSSRRASADEFRLPERRSTRLDRPPCSA